MHRHRLMQAARCSVIAAVVVWFAGCSESPVSPTLATVSPEEAAPEPAPEPVAATTAVEAPVVAEEIQTASSKTPAAEAASPLIDPRTQTSESEVDPSQYVYVGDGESDDAAYQLPEVEELKELPIQLDEALARALEHNLEVQIKTLDSELANDLIRQARGAFNPEFKIDLEYEDIDRPQNTQEFIETGGNANLLSGEPRIFEENNWRYKISLEGKLPTGTEYELFSQQEILSNTLSRTSALSLFTPEFQNFTGITLTQPLLRNFGTNVNLAEIRVARKNKRISELEMQDAMLNTISQTLIAYYDLVYVVEEMRLKEIELDLASDLTLEKREQLEKGQISPRDLTRAESALAEIIEELTQARNQVFEKQTVLQSLLTDIRIPDASTIYAPSTSLPVPEVNFDLNMLLAEAAEHRPAMKIARHTVEREDIRLVYAGNQIWPQLDVKATLGRNGLSANLGRSYRQSISSGQGNQWSVGFEFSVPLWNDTAIGQKQEAEHRKEQSVLQLKQVEVNTSLLIQQLLAIIDSNYQRLDAMQLFKNNASRSMEQEEIRLEKGLSTELEVLKFRRDLNRARVRELAARVDI
ncbi:MAG: TolC family protein, partial [Verrucomicrobiota bacterium]